MTNFTNDGPFTPGTDWSRLPCHRVKDGGMTIVTAEHPCDHEENHYERYCPVNTSDGRYDAIYQRYKQIAEKTGACHFIGRCGTYRCLDMHQVINQSLTGARRWLSANE